MRSILALVLISAAVFFGCNLKTEEQTSAGPLLKGPYLGMTPPGDVPEMFAPGLVSDAGNEHSGAVFTPDGSELFWTTVFNEGRSPRMVVVLYMKQENGVWTRPELAPFNRGGYTHINSISPDGKRLYYFSEAGGARVADKTENGWAESRLLTLNNSDQPGRHINEVHETRSGNFYLSGPLESMPGGRGIVCSKRVNGKYQVYESLGPTVNFPHNDPYPNHSPTVDPDERFVIFVSRRPGGFGTQDIYISYRQPDGSWGPAINLGPEINTVGSGNSWPQLSPDGKYLFFVSTVNLYDYIDEKQVSYAELKKIRNSITNGWGNIYWVSTRFIDDLKPEE